MTVILFSSSSNAAHHALCQYVAEPEPEHSAHCDVERSKSQSNAHLRGEEGG